MARSFCSRLYSIAVLAVLAIDVGGGYLTGIGSDTRTVELQLEAAVEIEPQSIGFGFTRWLRQHCPRSNETRC